jgi:hypothetical protein
VPRLLGCVLTKILGAVLGLFQNDDAQKLPAASRNQPVGGQRTLNFLPHAKKTPIPSQVGNPQINRSRLDNIFIDLTLTSET